MFYIFFFCIWLKNSIFCEFSNIYLLSAQNRVKWRHKIRPIAKNFRPILIFFARDDAKLMPGEVCQVSCRYNKKWRSYSRKTEGGVGSDPPPPRRWRVKIVPMPVPVDVMRNKVYFLFHLTTAIRCVFAAAPCVRSETRYRNPYNCKHFFICPSGTLVEDICDDGFAFDPTYSFCEPIDKIRWENFQVREHSRFIPPKSADESAGFM